MHVSPEFAVSFAWRFLHRLRGAVHSLGVALVLFMTLGCVDAKLSLAEEENGAEIVAVLMHSARPVQALHRQPGELVATARGHANVGRAVRSMSQVGNAFDDGHRMPNGLMAPLVT